MRKYGSMSWKRTWVWSNRQNIACLDLGPMTDHEKQSSKQTTTRYLDRGGRVRFKGNANLKRSQYFGEFLFIVSYFFRSSSCVIVLPKSQVLWRTSWEFRQYTYKFAGKLVRMIPKLRAEKVHLPIKASKSNRFSTSCFLGHVAKAISETNLYMHQFSWINFFIRKRDRNSGTGPFWFFTRALSEHGVGCSIHWMGQRSWPLEGHSVCSGKQTLTNPWRMAWCNSQVHLDLYRRLGPRSWPYNWNIKSIWCQIDMQN